MDLSEFTANYAQLGDDELLCLWADRNTLVPEAVMALDSELAKRGLNKQNATRIKKRLDALAKREWKGPLERQVAVAKYERNMRHFDGWKEPEFYSPYHSPRDIRNTFAFIRHKYRIWKAFRDHTGRWPVLSIWYHFLSWIAVLGFTVTAGIWTGDRSKDSGWTVIAVIGFALALIIAREQGARFVRKLDWKRCMKMPAGFLAPEDARNDKGLNVPFM